MGLLQVEAKLDPNQFWPSGSSDGDTAEVVVKRVTFEGNLTHAFEGAHVRGRVSKNVIDDKGQITVRFQGIDAPELHYMPTVAKAKAKKTNADFRQCYGRAAAKALGDFLRQLSAQPIECRVVSQVSVPNDVFDTYGRFIGDIIVTDQRGRDVDLNLWMAKTGWAFPTFYTSMTSDEIELFRKASAHAETKNLGIWKGYEQKLCFDGALLFKDADRARDAGRVSMPKVFRRLALDWVSQGDTKLHALLAAEPSEDRCYKTDELLEQGITVAKQYDLAELVTDARAMFKPGDVVFQEAGATLCDARGGKIVGW